MPDGTTVPPEIPVSWMDPDGWLFEAVPGTPYIIGTPEPERGVWVMGTDPEECRREWERLAPTWRGYWPRAGARRG